MENVDPDGNVRGQYGTVKATLHDVVMLKRAPKIETSAAIWESHTIYFHGPPETMASRAREMASDLTDQFVNEFLQQNERE